MSTTAAAPRTSLVTTFREFGLSLARRSAWLAPLAARIVIGLVFVNTGWGKLHNLDKVIEYFRSLGIPAPEIQAPFAAAMEFACGLLVLFGLFTRLASFPLMVIMVVAIVSAKGDAFTGVNGPLEWLNALFGLSEFLYIVILVGLAIGGAGALSLDRAFFGRGDRAR